MTMHDTAAPPALHSPMPIVNEDAPMSPETYRWMLEQLGLGVLEAGRFFGVSDKNAKKMAAEGPSPPVAKLLKFMLAKDYMPEDVNAAIRRWERD